MRTFNQQISKLIIITLTNLLIITSVFAQTPESFTYQAIVRDNSGQPLQNTSVTFQFNILQTSASGTIVYSEDQTATTNDFGLVNLQIGQGTVQSGNFSTIDWGSDTYFLNIKIDQGSGFVDMGTQQFLSVPYALFAKSAGNGGTTYTAGNGISITGNIIENTAPDQIVNITGGGATTVTGTYPNFTVSSTDNVDDADADSTNEIQALSVTGNQLSISGSGGNTVTMQVAAAGNSGDVQLNDNGAIGADPDLHWDLNDKKLVIGQDTSDGRMIIQQDPNAPDSIPILEVKNKAGQTIFVVYPDSVHIFIDDDNSKGVLKGGFAVSGRSGTKAVTNDFLLVRPDSTRIWTADSIAGFGVRDFSSGTETSYMQLTPENYFIGHESGMSLTDGLYNTFFGYKAGMSTTGGGIVSPGEYYGSNNIFIGYESGLDNTTGYNNIFVGYLSGTNNTSGVKNTFIGKSSGSTNSNGGYNTFLGYNSGTANSSGGANTFVGADCGFYNTTAYYNTCIGTYSGEFVSTGAYNTYIGSQSGHGGGTPGSYPSTFNTGLYNTALGYQSGYSNTSGDGNVFIGYKSGYNETGSNKLYIENSNSTTPLIYGEFDNDILKFNTHSTWVNHSSGISSNGLFINNTANADHWNIYQYSTGDLHLIFNGSDRGSFNQTTGAYTSLSDKSLKKNFEDLTGVLPKLDKMTPKRYNFKTQNDGDKKYIGFIAQDIKDLFPSLVSFNKESNLYMVDYAGFSVVAIEAIKEQQQRIEQQQNKINKLEKKLDELSNKIDNLKR